MASEYSTITTSAQPRILRGDYITVQCESRRIVRVNSATRTLTTRGVHRPAVEWLRAHWESYVAWPLADRWRRAPTGEER